jgi:hypothetical protein
VLVSVVGDWRGHWENVLGQHGDASWAVTSVWDDELRGTWDDLPFQGRRQGNVISFSAQGGHRNCIDYQVTIDVLPRGDTAEVRYDARNHCSGQQYSGTEELRRR